MLRNVLRKAAARGIPVAPPASHPFNPLLALRVSSLDMDEPLRNKLVSGLFAAVWAESRDVTKPDVVQAVATECGFRGRDVIAEAASPATKTRLREQTEAAIACEVFGVPTMIVDGQLFWGLDDLGFLDLFLAGQDPLPAGYESAWARVKPSASRLS
jgi:2-hydroxychromene-2-carboxylate isomerase